MPLTAIVEIDTTSELLFYITPYKLLKWIYSLKVTWSL